MFVNLTIVIYYRDSCVIYFLFLVFQQRLTNAFLLIHVSDCIITQYCRNIPYSISGIWLYHFDCEHLINGNDVVTRR